MVPLGRCIEHDVREMYPSSRCAPLQQAQQPTGSSSASEASASASSQQAGPAPQPQGALIIADICALHSGVFMHVGLSCRHGSAGKPEAPVEPASHMGGHRLQRAELSC